MSWLDDIANGLAGAFSDGSGLSGIDPSALAGLDPTTLLPLDNVDPTSPYSGAFNGNPSFGGGYDPSGVSQTGQNVLNSSGYGLPSAPGQMSPDEITAALQAQGYTPEQIAALSSASGGLGAGGGPPNPPAGTSGGIPGLGGLSAGQLIPLLAALGAGLYGSSNTKAATAQTVAAINQANTNLGTTATNLQGQFSPYSAMGNSAMTNIANSIGNSNLGSPNGRALSSMVKK